MRRPHSGLRISLSSRWWNSSRSQLNCPTVLRIHLPHRHASLRRTPRFTFRRRDLRHRAPLRAQCPQSINRATSRVAVAAVRMLAIRVDAPALRIGAELVLTRAMEMLVGHAREALCASAMHRLRFGHRIGICNRCPACPLLYPQSRNANRARATAGNHVLQPRRSRVDHSHRSHNAYRARAAVGIYARLVAQRAPFHLPQKLLVGR